MSWWKKLLGRSDPADPETSGPAGQTAWPVQLDVVSGKLSARVYQHDIAFQRGPISCWSYVSDGLAALDHPEIVFTLRRDPGEPGDGFPPDPLHLLATIHQLADDGQRVGPGGVTEFGARSFFGHHLLYVRAQPLDGVPLPASCLAALLITADELRAVRTFGATRVLARMGQASSYYPFPPWADRRRTGLSLARTFEHSLLSKLPRASTPDVRVGARNHQIIVSALRAAEPPWQDRLAEVPDTAPIALLTALDPTANGCLVWVPGQNAPEAITPSGSDGSRLCGCFVALVPDQPQNGGQMLEDGFVMELTRDSWNGIRAALVEGKDVWIPGAGDRMSFALTWRDQEYRSPIDGTSYVAEGGWDSYQPTTPQGAPATSQVAIGQVRLLTPQHEIEGRTSARELAVFCVEIQRCAQRVIGDRDDEAELLLRLRCRPAAHDVDLSGRGEVPEAEMQAFFEAVKQLTPLPVQGGEVSFEIELKVSRKT